MNKPINLAELAKIVADKINKDIETAQSLIEPYFDEIKSKLEVNSTITINEIGIFSLDKNSSEQEILFEPFHHELKTNSKANIGKGNLNIQTIERNIVDKENKSLDLKKTALISPIKTNSAATNTEKPISRPYTHSASAKIAPIIKSATSNKEADSESNIPNPISTKQIYENTAKIVSIKIEDSEKTDISEIKEAIEEDANADITEQKSELFVDTKEEKEVVESKDSGRNTLINEYIEKESATSSPNEELKNETKTGPSIAKSYPTINKIQDTPNYTATIDNNRNLQKEQSSLSNKSAVNKVESKPKYQFYEDNINYSSDKDNSSELTKKKWQKIIIYTLFILAIIAIGFYFVNKKSFWVSDDESDMQLTTCFIVEENTDSTRYISIVTPNTNVTAEYVAKTYYGDEKYAENIIKANSDIVENGNLLKGGCSIKIPNLAYDTVKTIISEKKTINEENADAEEENDFE